LPLPRWQVVRLALSSVVPFLRRVVSYQKRLPTLLAAAPQRCETLRSRIGLSTSADELRKLWDSKLDTLLREVSRMLAAGARSDGAGIVRLRPRLRKLVSDADATVLLTSARRSA
jgi:pyruvate,water dikinase